MSRLSGGNALFCVVLQLLSQTNNTLFHIRNIVDMITKTQISRIPYPVLSNMSYFTFLPPLLVVLPLMANVFILPLIHTASSAVEMTNKQHPKMNRLNLNDADESISQHSAKLRTKTMIWNWRRYKYFQQATAVFLVYNRIRNGITLYHLCNCRCRSDMQIYFIVVLRNGSSFKQNSGKWYRHSRKIVLCQSMLDISTQLDCSIIAFISPVILPASKLANFHLSNIVVTEVTFFNYVISSQTDSHCKKFEPNNIGQ